MRSLEELNGLVRKHDIELINTVAYETDDVDEYLIISNNISMDEFKTHRAIEVELPDSNNKMIKYRFSRGALFIGEAMKNTYELQYKYLYSEKNLVIIYGDDIVCSENRLTMPRSDWDKLKKALNRAYNICFNDEGCMEDKELRNRLEIVEKTIEDENSIILKNNLEKVKELKYEQEKSGLNPFKKYYKASVKFNMGNDMILYVMDKEPLDEIRKHINNKLNIYFYDYFIGQLFIDSKNNKITTVALVDAHNAKDLSFGMEHYTEKTGVYNLRFNGDDNILCKVLIIEHEPRILKNVEVENIDDIKRLLYYNCNEKIKQIDELYDIREWTKADYYEVKNVPLQYRYIVLKMLYRLKCGGRCDIKLNETYGIQYFNKILTTKDNQNEKFNIEEAIENCRYRTNMVNLLRNKFDFGKNFKTGR